MSLFPALMIPDGLDAGSALVEWQAAAEKSEPAAMILEAVRAQVRRWFEGTGGRLGPDEWSRASRLEQDLVIEARWLERQADRGRLSTTLAVVAGELAILLGADRERVAAYLETVGAPEFVEVLDGQAAQVVSEMPGVG